MVYCATPSRISSKKEEISSFVSKKGYAPLHPFIAFPFEQFEGNPVVGRKKSMGYCLKAVQICDEFWMFGVSKGTLEELNYAKKLGKPIKRIKVFENG